MLRHPSGPIQGIDYRRVCRFFNLPGIEPLSEIGIEFLELSSIKLGMKFREAGFELLEERSHALKEHAPSEPTTSLEASNE
jgi:hypothetical protein